MSVALIAMGVPGSGKTTFMRKLAEEYGLVYINKDAIREEILGNVNDQSKNREVWLESERRTTDALKNGQNVALDSTYAERWKREELVSALRKRGAQRVVGLYFDIPFERAQMQNQGREHIINEKSMAWVKRQFEKEPPVLSEGFDVLYHFDELERVPSELP